MLSPALSIRIYHLPPILSSFPKHKTKQGWVERDGYGLPGACLPGSALPRCVAEARGTQRQGCRCWGQSLLERWLCSPARERQHSRSARQQHHWSRPKGQSKELRPDTRPACSGLSHGPAGLSAARTQGRV